MPFGRSWNTSFSRETDFRWLRPGPNLPSMGSCKDHDPIQIRSFRNPVFGFKYHGQVITWHNSWFLITNIILLVIKTHQIGQTYVRN